MFPCLHHHHHHHTNNNNDNSNDNNNNNNNNNKSGEKTIGGFFGSYLKPAIFVDSTIVFAGFATSVKPQCKQDDHSSRWLWDWEPLIPWYWLLSQLSSLLQTPHLVKKRNKQTC